VFEIRQRHERLERSALGGFAECLLREVCRDASICRSARNTLISSRLALTPAADPLAAERLV
jgi:hypothetical protein